MKMKIFGKLTSPQISIASLLAMLAVFPCRTAAATRLDPTFGTGGKVTTNLVVPSPNTSDDSVSALAIQPDGKILAAGTQSIGSSDPNQRFVNFALVRYNTDGSLDDTFGTGGVVSFRNGLSVASDVAVQPDGKIVVFGDLNNHAGFLLARFNADGTLDTSFGFNGSVNKTVTSLNYAGKVIVQGDGRIVITGFIRNNFGSDGRYKFALLRYNTNGSLDDGTAQDSIPSDSFGFAGVVITDFAGDAFLNDAALQTDGKIVVAGQFLNNSNNEADFALARYNADGNLDGTFGTGGKLTTSFSVGAGDTANSLVVQPDGKIIAAGGGNGLALARYDAQGNLDATFGAGGKSIIGNTSVNASGIALRPDGKIYVTSAVGRDFSLALVNANGSLDTTFGTNGLVTTGFAGSFVIGNDILLQPDGKVVLAGYALANGSLPGNSDFALLRYVINSTNSKATAFDFDGDGKSDYVIARSAGVNSQTTWWIKKSFDNSYSVVSWGLGIGSGGDRLAPADYDNDGKTDLAIYRNGLWIILQSSNNAVRYANFGTAEDLPRPADFDGDGRADISVWRPTNGFWYRLNSSDNSFQSVQFGQTNDAPMIGDYDGDGKTDVAVYRPNGGLWFILRSTDNQYQVAQFGLSSDIPLNGDFTGDGRADLAVYRPSSGFWFTASANTTNPAQNFNSVQFGANGDTPAPADYDGDGKADRAVYRSGTWIILQSRTNQVQYTPFGLASDKPVPASYQQP